MSDNINSYIKGLLDNALSNNSLKYWTGNGYISIFDLLFADAYGTKEKFHLDTRPLSNSFGLTYSMARTDEIGMTDTDMQYMDFTASDKTNGKYARVNSEEEAKRAKKQSSENNTQDSQEVPYSIINLLMPQYHRRVEIEDLDKNFWVIGTVLDSIANCLWGRNRGIVQTLENSLQEIVNLKSMIGDNTIVDVALRFGENDVKNVFKPIEFHDIKIILTSEFAQREVKIPIVQYNTNQYNDYDKAMTDVAAQATEYYSIGTGVKSWNDVCDFYNNQIVNDNGYGDAVIYDSDLFSTPVINEDGSFSFYIDCDPIYTSDSEQYNYNMFDINWTSWSGPMSGSNVNDTVYDSDYFYIKKNGNKIEARPLSSNADYQSKFLNSDGTLKTGLGFNAGLDDSYANANTGTWRMSNTVYPFYTGNDRLMSISHSLVRSLTENNPNYNINFGNKLKNYKITYLGWNEEILGITVDSLVDYLNKSKQYTVEVEPILNCYRYSQYNSNVYSYTPFYSSSATLAYNVETGVQEYPSDIINYTQQTYNVPNGISEVYTGRLSYNIENFKKYLISKNAALENKIEEFVLTDFNSAKFNENYMTAEVQEGQELTRYSVDVGKKHKYKIFIVEYQDVVYRNGLPYKEWERFNEFSFQDDQKQEGLTDSFKKPTISSEDESPVKNYFCAAINPNQVKNGKTFKQHVQSLSSFDYKTVMGDYSYMPYGYISMYNDTDYYNVREINNMISNLTSSAFAIAAINNEAKYQSMFFQDINTPTFILDHNCIVDRVNERPIEEIEKEYYPCFDFYKLNRNNMLNSAIPTFGKIKIDSTTEVSSFETKTLVDSSTGVEYQVKKQNLFVIPANTYITAHERHYGDANKKASRSLLLHQQSNKNLNVNNPYYFTGEAETIVDEGQIYDVNIDNTKELHLVSKGFMRGENMPNLKYGNFFGYTVSNSCQDQAQNTYRRIIELTRSSYFNGMNIIDDTKSQERYSNTKVSFPNSKLLQARFNISFGYNKINKGNILTQRLFDIKSTYLQRLKEKTEEPTKNININVNAVGDDEKKLTAKDEFTLPMQGYLVIYGLGEDSYRLGKRTYNSQTSYYLERPENSNYPAVRYYFPQNTLFLRSNDLYNYEMVAITLSSQENAPILKIHNLPSGNPMDSKDYPLNFHTDGDGVKFYDIEEHIDLHLNKKNSLPLEIHNNFSIQGYKGALQTYNNTAHPYIYSTEKILKNDEKGMEIGTMQMPVDYFIPEIKNFKNGLKDNSDVNYYSPYLTIQKFSNEDYHYISKNLQKFSLLCNENGVLNSFQSSPLIINEFSLSGENNAQESFAGGGYMRNNQAVHSFSNLFKTNANAAISNNNGIRLNPNTLTVKSEENLRFSIPLLLQETGYRAAFSKTNLQKMIDTYNTTITSLDSSGRLKYPQDMSYNMLESFMGTITYYYQNIICGAFTRTISDRVSKPINLTHMKLVGNTGNLSVRNPSHYALFGIERASLNILPSNSYYATGKSSTDLLYPSKLTVLQVGQTGLKNNRANAVNNSTVIFRDNVSDLNLINTDKNDFENGIEEQEFNGKKYIGFMYLFWGQDEDNEPNEITSLTSLDFHGSTLGGYTIF